MQSYKYICTQTDARTLTHAHPYPTGFVDCWASLHYFSATRSRQLAKYWKRGNEKRFSKSRLCNANSSIGTSSEFPITQMLGLAKVTSLVRECLCLCLCAWWRWYAVDVNHTRQNCLWCARRSIDTLASFTSHKRYPKCSLYLCLCVRTYLHRTFI